MQRTLSTKRLALRPLVLADEPWITSTVQIPDVYRNVANIPAGQTSDQTRTFIETCMEGDLSGTNTVRIIEMDDKPLGLCGLHRKVMRQPFELGYWLHPDAWGQGVVTEAAARMLEWADRNALPKLILSGHFVDNPASGAILRKHGFLPSDRRPVFCAGRNEKVDHIFMSRISG